MKWLFVSMLLLVGCSDPMDNYKKINGHVIGVVPKKDHYETTYRIDVPDLGVGPGSTLTFATNVYLEPGEYTTPIFYGLENGKPKFIMKGDLGYSKRNVDNGDQIVEAVVSKIVDVGNYYAVGFEFKKDDGAMYTVGFEIDTKLWVGNRVFLTTGPGGTNMMAWQMKHVHYQSSSTNFIPLFIF